MRKSKVHPAVIVVGALLVIGLSLLLIFRQATQPGETINYDYKKIPPKGAGAVREGR
jgi:hypothetical protein